MEKNSVEAIDIVNNSSNKVGDMESHIDERNIILYKTRWLMLFMFTTYSFSNAYQWIHLNIISEKVSYFWNNSLPSLQSQRDQAINWLSLVYMFAYVPLVIPAMWFLKNKGLRATSLIASFLNALGAWIKCASISSDGNRFPVLLCGQIICAVAQIFILGIPAHLAAVWFGADEVSTATSLGVFGNQLGIGFGFVIPPLIFSSLRENHTIEEYQSRFSIMFYTGASIMTFLFVLICFAFKNKPPTPPSYGQLALAENTSELDYKQSILSLFKDLNFLALFFSYGINTGIFYSISTILNMILQYYFKNESSLIGTAGLLMIVSGIISAVIIGIILDKSKAFKSCIFVVYVCSTISMCGFAGGLYLNSWAVVFITMILLGFFMTGYLPLGFELAAEITYPIIEGLTSGLLNLSAQVFGIILTFVGTAIFSSSGPLYTNITYIICLIIGIILTIIMKVKLKRQNAHQMGSETECLNETDAKT